MRDAIMILERGVTSIPIRSSLSDPDSLKLEG